jgi:hydroxymethylpyrimidine kinase/phosphomethylpyrimidine kinase
MIPTAFETRNVRDMNPPTIWQPDGPHGPRPGGFVLAIGGFDPDGGAGVVRDFLTARTLGAAVRLVPTAWTEQSPAGVRSVEPRDGAALEAAIRFGLGRGADETLLGGAGLAVKIGMVPSPDAAAAILAGLAGFEGPVVLDPVLTSSSGGALFRGDRAGLLALATRARLVTPNAGEAAALTGIPVGDPDAAAAAGRALCALGVGAVLIKGGHLAGAEAVDVLVTTRGSGPGQTERRFAGPRLDGPPVRGTGCALATAIAVGLARGSGLDQAITNAKGWLATQLARPVPVGGEWHLPSGADSG